MQRHTRVVVKKAGSLLVGCMIIGAMFLGLLTAGAGTSAAQTGDPALDALRDAVPEGFPGKRDLTQANAEFGRLVGLYGQTTQVEPFGTESVLTGPCGGYAYSYNQDGVLIDAALDLGDDTPPVDILDGGQAFTASNRFRVDARGIVVYYGFSPAPGDVDGPQNHNWWIKTSGISLDSGGDPNANLKNQNSGIVDLDQDLPVKFSANVEVEGFMESQNLADCVGKGHVSIEGNGLTDPVGVAALALLGGGIFGLLFNARPAMTYRGSA